MEAMDSHCQSDAASGVFSKAAKDSDARWAAHVARYGNVAVELDALAPDVLQRHVPWFVRRTAGLPRAPVRTRADLSPPTSSP